MTTTGVFKRPFDVDIGRRQRAKRPRTRLTTGRRLSIIDVLEAGAVYDVDKGAEGARRLVCAALAPTGEALAETLGDASPAQVASAMLSLLGNATAFGRLCRSVSVCPLRGTIPCARTLYEAALRGHAEAVGVMLSVPCPIDDISEALMLCMQRGSDDPRTVAAIVEACEIEPEVTVSGYREIVRYALRDAVHLRLPRVVAYLADVAETGDIERHLWLCALDRDDPRASLFAALWRSLGLCVHAYAAALPSCPALDYLTAVANAGAPSCPATCSERPDDTQSGPVWQGRHLRQ